MLPKNGLFLILSVVYGSIDPILQAISMADVKRVVQLLEIRSSGIISSHPGVHIGRIADENGRISLMMCGYHPKISFEEDIDERCCLIAQMLYEHGANISHSDKYGWNALAMGAVKGFTKLSQFYVSRGVPVDSVDYLGRTPLMKAAFHGYKSTVGILIENGASISFHDNNNWTALHFCVRQVIADPVFVPVLETLLYYVRLSECPRCVIDAKDGHMRSALAYAVTGNSMYAVKLLLDAGADPEQTDETGVALLHSTYNDSIRELLSSKITGNIVKDHQKWVKQESEKWSSL